MNWAFVPLHIVNTYNAFGSITRTRYGVVLQGTCDETTYVGPVSLEDPQFTSLLRRRDWR